MVTSSKNFLFIKNGPSEGLIALLNGKDSSSWFQIILSGFDSKLNKKFYTWATDLGIEIVKEVIVSSIYINHINW